MKIAPIRDRARARLVREHTYQPPELLGMTNASREAVHIAGMDGLSWRIPQLQRRTTL